jgi:broad specificity phosphatase PhoE
MVEAWLLEKFPCEGESWKAFRERVASRRHSIGPIQEDANIVVFTSATPIGVWTALSMDVHDHRAMKLAGVIQNTAYTVIRLHGSELRLHTFNAVPHLPAAELRTHR